MGPRTPWPSVKVKPGVDRDVSAVESSNSLDPRDGSSLVAVSMGGDGAVLEGMRGMFWVDNALDSGVAACLTCAKARSDMRVACINATLMDEK